MLSVITKLKPAKTSPNSLGSPLRVLANTIAIFIFSQVLVSFLVTILVSLVDYGYGSKFLSENSITAGFLFVLFAEGLVVFLVFKLVRRRGLGLEAIGLGRKPVWDDLAKILIGFFLFFGLVLAVNMIIKLLFPDFKTDQKQNLGFNDLRTNYETVLAFIALVLFPPIGEEILVRGYLYSGLRAGLKLAPAVISTSFVFAIAHLEIGSGGPLVWGAAIQTFVLSLVLIYLREKSGALYAGMGLHMLNNLIAFFVIYH